MTELEFRELARQLAQAYVNSNDDTPRILVFALPQVEGLRAGEQVKLTLRREHRTMPPVPQVIGEAVMV